MHPSENPAAPGGVQTRLAAPGGRTRASSTRTATVRPQITPSHSPGIHRISERMHPSAH
jgi:hypothetical protein